MIYQLTAPLLPVPDPALFGLLPPGDIGLGLWFAGLAALLVILGFAACGRNPPRWLALLVPSVFFAGLFVHAYGLIDEVSVNLEHPYNLLHHGVFSMQPDKMVDGTVEFFFYLLHTPFAFTPQLLVLGNFLLCLLVGWLHIFALWKYRVFEGRLHGVLPLALVACSFHLVGLTATGFGNALLSLVFLLAIIAQLNKRPVLALFIGALLPLLRPEGIVWAGVNVLAVLFTMSNHGRQLRRPKFYLALFSPLITAALYFCLYKTLYGHFIPTPLLFKSTALGPLQNLNGAQLQNGLNAILDTYKIIPLAIGLMIFVLVPIIYRQARKRNESYLSGIIHAFSRKMINWLLRGQVREFGVILAYFAGCSLVMAAWLLTNFSYTNPIDRYYIIFFLCLSVLLAKIISLALSEVALGHALEFYAQVESEKWIIKIRYAAWAGVFLYLAFCIPYARDIDIENGWLFNRTHMALAGKATEKLVPKNYALAASEMNTFGLMQDRPILDLWGYSNRAIAGSHLCTRVNIKVQEGAFLKARPDIYFPHWFTEFPFKHNYATVEESFMQSFHSHGNIHFNRITDLPHVFAAYDFVIATYPSLQLGYLVRNDLTRVFLKNLEGQGLSLQKSRKVNPGIFKNEQFRKFHAC